MIGPWAPTPLHAVREVIETSVATVTTAWSGPPRVSMIGFGKGTIFEGQTVGVQIDIEGSKPPFSFVLETTGALASDGDWVETFEQFCLFGAQARGCTVTRLTSRACRIHVGDAYDRQPMILTRRAALDARTEGTEQWDLFMRDATYSVVDYRPINCVVNPNRRVVSRFVQNFDATPPTAKTYRLRRTTPSAEVNEGETLTFDLETQNIDLTQPFRTKMRLQTFNTGSRADDWTESFRDMARRCVEAAGCGWENISLQTGVVGGTITFLPTYKGVINFDWTCKADRISETRSDGRSTEQCDILLDEVNDPEMLDFGHTVSVFILDTSREPTNNIWRVAMSPSQPQPGGTLTYTLSSPTGTSDGTIRIAPFGNATDGDFNTSLAGAIQAAIPSHPGLSFNAGTMTLTTTPAWDGEFVFTRSPNANGYGKAHGLDLVEPSQSPLTKVDLGSAMVYIGTTDIPNEPSYLTGVNCAGAEFGHRGQSYTSGAYNYGFGSTGYAQFQYWIDQGCSIIRFPFFWERIQEELYGEFNDLGRLGKVTLTYDQKRLKDAVEFFTSRGVYVILDVHNYDTRAVWNFPQNEDGSYPLQSNGQAVREVITSGAHIGDDECPRAAYHDFWTRLANIYKDNHRVWFCVMNEPNGISAPRQYLNAQGVTNAIRKTGAKNKLMISGTAYTGAWSWISSGNAAAMMAYRDPAENYCFEVHQYLDSDSSGTQGSCTFNAGNRLTAITNWARTNGKKLFLGEFNGGVPTVVGQEQCGIEIPKLIANMNNNKDVWIGWTAWGAGRGWAESYIFKLDPIKDTYTSPSRVDKPLWTQYIKPYLQRVPAA